MRISFIVWALCICAPKAMVHQTRAVEQFRFGVAHQWCIYAVEAQLKWRWRLWFSVLETE